MKREPNIEMNLTDEEANNDFKPNPNFSFA